MHTDKRPTGGSDRDDDGGRGGHGRRDGVGRGREGSRPGSDAARDAYDDEQDQAIDADPQLREVGRARLRKRASRRAGGDQGGEARR
ncbi:hypothetical protein O7599_29880 [Streptomyces sp. WMMC500]|uniref:hypothetical protein n=1 Tax=Streptomyces sp. WMMC500 TaxID=3015154 RepID=UPI00248C2B0A|nr:hypothetical protein [Streptomyces sp. WMMC500]WBB59722.1 hypothetical protein O7599_29880 [Streptomyces sp. WMMC500]